MPRISNSENSENFQFGKLKKFPAVKIPKISNSKNCPNFKISKNKF